MSTIRTIARSFIYICILTLALPGAYTQELPRVANTGLTGSSAMVTPQNMFDGTQDVLFGKNTKGPYTLSWKPIDRNSESVSINNHRVERGVDYNIDYASGVLAFTSPVANGAVIKVEYKYDPKTATRNASAVSMPLTLDLLKRDNRNLQFTALYKQAGADPKQTSDLMILGLSGSTKLESGQLSTMFLFTPESDDENTVDASFIDRAAMQLGGDTSIGGLKLTTSYSRIGEHFQGAKEHKLKPGMEVMDFGAAYSLTDALSLNASTKRTEQLAGDKAGEVTSTNTYSAAYAGDGAPKLNVSRTEVEKERPDADVQRTTTDQVKIEHQLSPDLKASATHQNVLTQDGDTESRVTTNQFTVNTKVGEKVGVDSSLTQKNSTEKGDETRVKFDVTAAPSQTLSVKAAVSRLDTDASGRDNSESLKLTAKPSDKLNIEMNLAHRDSEELGTELGHSMKVVSSFLSYLNMVMDWATRDSEFRGNEQVGKLQLEASPWKMLSVSAAIGMHDTEDAHNLSREARMTLKPFDHTTIGGGYSEQETDGTVVAKVTDVNASTKPVKYIQVGGGYKQRQQLGEDDLNSVNVGMVLDSGGLLKLTGDYSRNPENSKGAVLRENNQKIGLLTDFGRLKLKGDYTIKDSYLDGKRSEVRQVGIDYRLSAYSSLTTSYKTDELHEQSMLGTNVYALGYTHRVGSDFNLYLGGTLTTYEENQRIIEGKTEYEAQANLGVRF